MNNFDYMLREISKQIKNMQSKVDTEGNSEEKYKLLTMENNLLDKKIEITNLI